MIVIMIMFVIVVMTAAGFPMLVMVIVAVFLSGDGAHVSGRVAGRELGAMPGKGAK